MKISLNWLKQLGTLPDISPNDIGEKITLHTAELEEVIDVQKNFKHVFAGKLVKTAPHPQSEKLRLGQFDLGDQGTKQIVYGAAFALEVGKVYPIALPGAVLATGQKITASEMKGEKSEGMACNNPELGMKNDAVLEFDEAQVGKSLPEISAEFADHLFDIDNKSLTHRPDLMGHRGFAREYSALFDAPRDRADFTPIKNWANQSQGALPVEIQTPHCRRFMGIHCKNVSVHASALDEMVRLENLGTRAISNIVDSTNLVMLEWGQPMHAFDANKICGKIIIRQAQPGEKLVALDENEYELTPDDVVIADEEKVLSIAGVMGGLASAVTEQTTEVIFEAANFDPAVIRKTSARLALRSESSMRFEKSLDPENASNGLFRALELLQKSCPESIPVTSITDKFPRKNDPKIIDLPLKQVRSLSGIDVTDEDIIRILTALEFECTPKSAEVISVTTPSFRATKDIQFSEDLIEEIVRIQGFDAIPERLPALPIRPPQVNRLRQLEWKIRDFLANQGVLEVYHTAFVSPQDAAWSEQKDHVQTLNATSEEAKYLRKTLLSNFVRHLETELRTQKRVEFFEIGKVYQVPTNEYQKLGIVFAEIGGTIDALFYQLKGLVSALGKRVQAPAFTYRPQPKPSSLQHPYVAAEIFAAEKSVGEIFALFPTKNNTKNSVVLYAEIDLEQLLLVAESVSSYQKLSEFPASSRDLSLVLSRQVLMGDVVATAKNSAEFLTDIQLFDEYEDEIKLGSDLKNLAFHLSFQAPDQTLDHEAVETDLANIVAALRKNHGAELRVDFDKKNSKI